MNPGRSDTAVPGEGDAVAAGTQLAGPVTGAERITSIDTLRGVAVLGILVMNIYFFAMPSAAYSNPLAYGGNEWHNLGTWFFTHIFFDQKFLSIFAMLFGAGVLLMTGRAEACGKPPAGILLRRQFWLLLIGAAHAYLLWFGDILFVYAIAGMIVYLFRRRSSTVLIIIACLALPIPPLMSAGFSARIAALQAEAAEITAARTSGVQLDADQEELLEAWKSTRAHVQPSQDDIADEISAYKKGYLEILNFRLPRAAQTQMGLLAYYSWRILSLMLIGMVLMRLDVLTAARSEEFYRRFMLGGYLVGLPLTIYSGIDLHEHGFDALYRKGPGGLANYLGSIIVALGHVGLVMLVVKTGYVRRLMSRFAAVGRMALTNYLLHSAVMTTIFYGYGLGFYGEIPRFWQMGFVAAMIAVQLVLSPWWLRHFRFGPVEWLWRSLTYGRRQPMRQPVRL